MNNFTLDSEMIHYYIRNTNDTDLFLEKFLNILNKKNIGNYKKISNFKSDLLSDDYNVRENIVKILNDSYKIFFPEKGKNKLKKISEEDFLGLIKIIKEGPTPSLKEIFTNNIELNTDILNYNILVDDDLLYEEELFKKSFMDLKEKLNKCTYRKKTIYTNNFSENNDSNQLFFLLMEKYPLLKVLIKKYEFDSKNIFIAKYSGLKFDFSAETKANFIITNENKIFEVKENIEDKIENIKLVISIKKGRGYNFNIYLNIDNLFFNP